MRSKQLFIFLLAFTASAFAGSCSDFEVLSQGSSFWMFKCSFSGSCLWAIREQHSRPWQVHQHSSRMPIQVCKWCRLYMVHTFWHPVLPVVRVWQHSSVRMIIIINLQKTNPFFSCEGCVSGPTNPEFGTCPWPPGIQSMMDTTSF